MVITPFATPIIHMEEKHTLIVTGLNNTINQSDLLNRFSKLISVVSCELYEKDVGNVHAKVTVKGNEDQLHRCVSLFSGCKWSGAQLTVTEEGKPKKVKRQKRKKENLEDDIDVQTNELTIQKSVKHIRSNQQRLLANEQRSKEQNRRLSVPLLTDTPSHDNHIIFDSEDEADKEVIKEIKVKLFDDDDDKDYNSLPIKEQFEGRVGKKLFQLQTKIGSDYRFKMDERFLESNSEETDDDDNHKEESDISMEKAQALQIIEALLGKEKHTLPTPNQEPILSVKRYDPDCQDCDLLELTTPTTKASSPIGDVNKKPTESSLPHVSEDRFYTVSTELSKQFSTAEKGSFQFSFLTSDNNINDVTKSEITQELMTSKPNWLKKLQNTSLETDAIVNEEFTTKEEEEKNISDNSFKRPLFFFHADDPMLRNRIDEGQFCRTQSLQDLFKEWADKRRKVKASCRRIRKETQRRMKRNMHIM